MAEAVCNLDDAGKSLNDIFLEGWKLFEELNESQLNTNSTEYQNKVKKAMHCFETATRLVSQIDMFSSNELIEELPTDSVQYLLLPFYLGTLAMKMQQNDRVEILNIAEIYFKDFLKRCEDYNVTDTPINIDDGTSDNKTISKTPEATLLQAAQTRNLKIMQLRRKNALKEKIQKFTVAVQNNTIDDEGKRDYFMNLLKKCLIDAGEELQSCQLEKQMAEIRQMNLTVNTRNGDGPSSSFSAIRNNYLEQEQFSNHMHKPALPEHKPMKPFIITRDTAQKAVFGMGYPSLPVLTVGEFYNQRVQEGIFPNEDKVKEMNLAQAIAAAQDPNEKEDQENAVIEEQTENDDPAYLERMRRLDEYKDVVRRGDGNRYNRS